VGGISERHTELGRRRHRKQKVAKLHKKYVKATASEKAVIVDKLRRLTPGADVILANWGAEK
jgi:hypothetical protein